MVFEKLGSLRYHGLWAYTVLAGIALVLDKVPLPDIQALAILLGPIALVIAADVAKHKSDKTK